MQYTAKVLIGIALVLAMIIIPVSADFKTVPNVGDTVFVGEEGLDVSILGNTSPVTIGYYTSGQSLTDVPTYTVQIADLTNFYVSSEFSGRTGLWYVISGGIADPTKYIRVSEPNVKVYVRNSGGDDVTGKSVVRGTQLDFRVETNLYEIRERSDTETFPFAIKVRSPDGVVYTSLYIDESTAKSLTNLPVSSSLWLWSTYATDYWDTSVKVGGSSRYVSGTYDVSAECNVNNLKDNNAHAESSISKVTIASDTLQVTVNKDSVTRGSQFIVTIQGTPSVVYNMFIKSPVTGETPKIIDNQEKVVKINDYKADVTTDSSGNRAVGFSTDANTKAKRWTIRVEDTTDVDRYDEVTVRVESGVLSVTTEGSGVYYLGEEIVLTGTNTETDTVYFFITGPNLPSGGGKLTDPRAAAGFVSANVKDDNSFEYKWHTDNLAIDSGAYTVYAVSEPVNKDHLADVQYDTVSINFRKPYITAQVIPSNVATGDEVHIKGNAGVETASGIAIWVMGKNYFTYDVESVDSDGTYDYEISSGTTEDLATGQYFVVVQHPMYNDQFDVYIDGNYVSGEYPTSGSKKFQYAGPGALQGSDAANALVNALDDTAVDDTYARTQFVVAAATITINPIKPVTIGQEFTISGLTNLAVGDDILIEAVSESFGPTKKTTSGEFSGFSGTTDVVAGTSGWNAFSINASSANFIKDQYIVTASSVTNPVTGSTTFDVVEFVPTPTPTPTTIPTTVVPTTVVTTVSTVPTTIPATSTETQPEKAPGFGAVIAVSGLGLTWYMIHRKKED